MNFKNPIIFTLVTLFLVACGDNTTKAIVSDIEKLTIDNLDKNIYSTDSILLNASLKYENNEDTNVTNNIKWLSSDYSLVNIKNNTLTPVTNSGDVKITAKYEALKDKVTLHIVGLKDLNNSWSITSTEIKSTGEFPLIAEGNFTDGTNNKKILHNISWSSSNETDEITLKDDYSVFIEIKEVGSRDITARMFDNNETDKTITVTIK